MTRIAELQKKYPDASIDIIANRKNEGIFRCCALTLVVTVVGAMLLLSACSVTSAPPASPTVSQTSTAVTKPYGSLTIAVNFGTTLDPIGAIGVAPFIVGSAVYDGLVYYDADGKLQPWIALRIEIAPDGLSHTFYIRKGVKFHDGSDLTGADVKFTFETNMAPDSLANMAATWRAEIDRVELKDDYTVVVRLKKPRFEFLDSLTTRLVTPKKYIEEKGVDYFRRHPVGSGPWKVVSFTPGNRVELEANEDYWDPGRLPKFKNITGLTVTDESTRGAMLKTGELDIAQVAPDSMPALKSAGLRMFSYAGGTQYFGWIFYDVDNPQKYALGDRRVRKAMQLSINSKEMIDKFLGGAGQPYALMNISSLASFYDPNQLKPDPYDLEQAKKLLAEAGYPNGFDTTFYNSAETGLHAVVNQALVGYWQRAGIRAEMVNLDKAVFLSKLRNQWPETWNGVWTGIGQAAYGFEKMAIAYHSKQAMTHNVKNPRLDELIEKVLASPDSAEKKRLSLEAALLAKSEYSTLAIFEAYMNVALGPKVGQMSPFMGMTDILGWQFATITHAK